MSADPWARGQLYGRGPSLQTSASCMDFRQRREQRPTNQHNIPRRPLPDNRQVYQPYSSPLPSTQWTDVDAVYRPQNWVDPNEVSPVATRQQMQQSMMPSWQTRSTPPQTFSDRREPRDVARSQRRPPRIFRREVTVELTSEQPFDVSMLYPEMRPYDPNRLSTSSAPEHLHNLPMRSISQPNSPGFVPPWSAMPSREEEPSFGIPRSPTYPPAGRRRMHSASGVGDAAFQDEQDFRLFVEATAGLPPDIGFSHTTSGPSPTRTSQQSPRRRHPTRKQTLSADSISPSAETPTTMHALQQLASYPEASQTFRPEPRTTQPRAQAAASPLPQILQPAISQPARPQTQQRSLSNRERMPASASGLDLWLPTPLSPHPNGSFSGPSTSRAQTFPDVSPITEATPRVEHPGSSLPFLNNEIQRQLEELELSEEEDRDFDDELPNYAQSQAEAQAERRAEASRRAQELQSRWAGRGR